MTVQLRVARIDDAPALVEAMAGACISNFEMLREGVPTVEEEVAYLQRLASENSVMFLVLLDNRIIGTCGLHEVDKFNHTARIGTIIFQESDRNHHYGAEAIEQLIATAFEQCGIEKLYANVIVTNTKQIDRDKRFGFRQEGYLKKHYLLNGERHDMVQLALLKQDWKAQ